MSSFSLSDREQQHFNELFASLDADKQKKLDLRRTSEFLSKCDLPIDQFEQVRFLRPLDMTALDTGHYTRFLIFFFFFSFDDRYLKFAEQTDSDTLVEVNCTLH
jgi:hypothetical protein